MSQHIDPPMNQSSIVDNLTTDDGTKALSAAQGKALSDKMDGVAVPNGDCNNATETGRYYTSLSTANAPSATHWVIDVIKYNDNEISQIARNVYTSNVVCTRAKLNGTWSTWEELALNSNLADVREYYSIGNVSTKSGLDYWMDRIISENLLSNNFKKLAHFTASGNFDSFVNGVAYFIDLSVSSANYATALIQGIGHYDIIQGKRTANDGWSYTSLTVQNTYPITLSSGWSANVYDVTKVGNVCILQVNGLKTATTSGGWVAAGTLNANVKPSSRIMGYLSCDTSMTAGKSPIAEVRVNTDRTFELYAPQANEAYWGGFIYFCDR